MEALGLEEAAAQFDDKFVAMKKIIDETGQRGKNAWKEGLRIAGVEEEEEEEREEEEEEEKEEEREKEKEGERTGSGQTNGTYDDANGPEDAEYSNQATDKQHGKGTYDEDQANLIFELVESEAKNHATVLYILKAMEKLLF